VAHSVFYIIAKDPQVQHVATQMHEAPVQKHRGKRGQYRVYPGQLRRQLCLVKDHGRNHTQRIQRRLLARAQR